MGVNTDIPKQKRLSNPAFTILADGQVLKSKIVLASIMVTKAVNRIPMARIAFYDGEPSNPETKNFDLSGDATFKPGAEIIIKAGYGSSEEKIFAGIVIKQTIKAPLGSAPMLVVELKHKAVKMTVNRNNKYFENKLDSDIMQKLLNDNGLTPDVTATTVMHKEMVQYYATDWDFVLSRAEVNGQLVIVGDDKVTIKQPSFALKGDSVNLVYGTNIREFDVEMDAYTQYESVVGQTWDYSKQELVEKTSNFKWPGKEEGNLSGDELSKVLGVKKFLLQHSGKLLNEELQAWSNAKLFRSRLSKIKGKVSIYGTSAIKPGDMVNLSGTGKRFNGAAFVSGVVHSYEPSTPWITDIQLGFSEEWFAEEYDNIVDVPAAGLLPAVTGLVNGIVTDIVDQEGGEFRVRVRIPVISKDDKGVWARIVSSDAGNGRGILIRPEKDDEVILGFVNDDPRDPVILGMVYSKKNKVPDDLTPDADNKKKGWLTKSKIKIIIDDDKKIVTVETPGKNSIVIDDDKKAITLKDQNKNSIVMDDKGITLESGKDVIVKAKGKITMEGQQDVTAESKSGKMLVKGSTGTEVSTSAQLTIKGSLVKIN